MLGEVSGATLYRGVHFGRSRSRFQRTRMSLNSNVAVMRPHMIKATIALGLAEASRLVSKQGQRDAGVNRSKLGAGRWTALRIGAMTTKSFCCRIFPSAAQEYGYYDRNDRQCCNEDHVYHRPALDHARAFLSNPRSRIFLPQIRKAMYGTKFNRRMPNL
jgi:hypothetical protein